MADDMTPGIASGATEDEMPDAALTNDMRDEFVDMPGTASAASTEDQSADEEDLSYSIYDQPDRVGLFEGDVGDLPAEARYALTRLVRDRYVADEMPGKYRTSTYSLILTYRDDLSRCLNNLCLVLNVNEKYRVAWASTAPFDGDMPGVVLKRAAVQRRDVTLLLVTLRIAAQNAELDGREHWYIDRSEIENAFVTISPYADEGDAEHVRRRIESAITEACTLGYLEKAKAAEGRYRILPVLPAIMTLERATDLVEQLRSLVDEGEE